MNDLMQNFNGSGASLPGAVAAAESALGIILPEDYRAFLEAFGGGEGWVGGHYLILWKATELHQFNVEYEFPKYAPAFVAFGGNGGGEAFAFDVRHSPYGVAMVPYIGMSDQDAIFVATSFTNLLERMKEEDSLF